MLKRIKHSIMTALVAVGLERVVVAYWKLKGDPTSQFEGRDLKDVFQRIYDGGIWMGSSETETSSGKGSSLTGTASVRDALPKTLATLGVRRMVDIGCGDFNWMKTVDLSGIQYTGIDAAKSVIERNLEIHGSENVHFIVADATKEAIPAADFALCREVVFHLSYKDGLALFSNLKKHGVKFVACTTDPSLPYNSDIPSGAWRDINLSRRPYRFPDPILVIPDGQPDNPNRILGIWTVADLPV